jgi:hypothetical protein
VEVDDATLPAVNLGTAHVLAAAWLRVQVLTIHMLSGTSLVSAAHWDMNLLAL